MTTLRAAFGLAAVATALTAPPSAYSLGTGLGVFGEHTTARPAPGVEPRRERRAPSDTIARNEKVRPERATPPLPPSKKKPAKQPRIVFPGESSPVGRQAPDQPWETTFLVRSTKYVDPSVQLVNLIDSQ